MRPRSGGSIIGKSRLSTNGFFWNQRNIDKLSRIGELRCNAFIDDLPEFLAEDGFPAGVVKVLFDPNLQHSSMAGVERLTGWAEAASLLTMVAR